MLLTTTLFAAQYAQISRLTMHKLKAHYYNYGTHHDYEEAVSKATVQILEILKITPSIEITSIGSYFYMIASRRLIDLKRGGKWLVYPENLPIIAAEKAKSTPLSMEALSVVLNELPDDVQHFIELKYRVLPPKTLQNMSLIDINHYQNQPCLNYKAIAKAFGIEKEGALRQRFSRLKPMLKAALIAQLKVA